MQNQELTQARRPDFAEIARRSFELYEGHARIDAIVFGDADPEDDSTESEELESPESIAADQSAA